MGVLNPCQVLVGKCENGRCGKPLLKLLEGCVCGPAEWHLRRSESVERSCYRAEASDKPPVKS